MEDILIESFIIFIKDDGKLTDRDILNGLEYPEHQEVKEGEKKHSYNVRISRYGGWIYILDDFSYKTWNRSETWKFIAKIAKTHDIIHCTMEDNIEGGMFGYHKNGELIRFIDYIREDFSSENMKMKVSEGTPLDNETETLKDRNFWFMKLTKSLGIDIKESNKKFILYNNPTLHHDDFQNNDLHHEDWSTTDCYTPYNYYKK